MSGIIEAARKVFKGGNLKARAARGGAWLGVATSTEQALRFLRNIILARILVPEAFGLMALVMAANSAFEAFTEVGVRPCVIQSKRGLEHELLNAAWWFSAVRGAGLYLVAMLSAPLVSAAYGQPDLLPLLRVAFVVTLLNGLVSPRIHALEKEMRYGRWVIITQGSGVIAVVVAIGAAVWLENVWALVIGLIAGAFSRTILSFVVCPLLPRLKVDRDSLGEILRFARGMLGLPILMMVFLQAPFFVLGKMRPMGELGVFSLAYGLANIPLMLFGRALLPLMLPAFSELQENKERLRRVLLAAVKATALLGLPVAAFMGVFARSALTLAYGEAYAGGAAALTVLALCMPLTMIDGCIVSVFFGLGMPGVHRFYSLLRVIVLLVTIVPAIWLMGMTGAAISVAVAHTSPALLQLGRLRKLIGVPGGDILAAGREGALLGGVVLLSSLGARLLFGSFAYGGLATGALVCIAALSISAVRVIAMEAQ